jgi:hypothetical protein
MKRPPPEVRLLSGLDGLALALASTTFLALSLWTLSLVQVLWQRPARQGVMTIHIQRDGHLRVWNQPIPPQEVARLVRRAEERWAGAQPLVVRLIPDPDVAWGAIHQSLQRLRPTAPQDRWLLQLQVP